MIGREEVLRIAALARLELSPVEVERMTGDLSKILEHVAQLQRVQDAAPEPEQGTGTPRREDRVVPSRYTAELLDLAPAREGALVRVPRVIEAAEAEEPSAGESEPGEPPGVAKPPGGVETRGEEASRTPGPEDA